MEDVINSSTIRRATQRAADALIRHADEFNRLDAMGGDGDMGTTLAALARAICEDNEPFPADIGACLTRIVRVFARVSGSSLSAVVMTGLMEIAKDTSGKTELAWRELTPLIKAAISAIQARSKAKLGDKTILDGLAAVVAGTEGCETAVAFTQNAERAVSFARRAFRDRPAAVGRLRLAAGNGVGHDDPGMVALETVVSAIASDRPF